MAELIKETIYQLHDESVRYEDYSGHSLRRGFLTSAGQEKADLLKLIAQSRHTRVDTVLSYIDDVELFEHHAAERLLLSVTDLSDPLVKGRDDDAGLSIGENRVEYGCYGATSNE